MANERYVNGDPNFGADVPDTQPCAHGGQWGHSAKCPYLTIQFGVDELARVGGGTLHVANYQYKENVVMDGAKYSHISIVGELLGAITKPIDPQFCEQRPLLTAKDPAKSVVSIKGGAADMKLENLNLAKGKHGLKARDVQTISLISCCIHDNVSDDEPGGGFWFYDGCAHVLVKDCRVYANKATGAVKGKGGGGAIVECNDVAVEGNYFHTNEAKLEGGGLRLYKCPDPDIKPHGAVTIDDNIFGGLNGAAGAAVAPLANKAEYGGSIFVDFCDDLHVLIGMTTPNRHYANHADKGGGAIAVNFSKCRIADIFEQNKADQDGGALFLHDDFEVRLIRADFSENEATKGDGGAIFASGDGKSLGVASAPGELIVEQSRLRGNKAPEGKGGGLYAAFDIKVKIKDSSSFKNNKAETGGGLFYSGASAVKNYDIDITGCSFDENVANNFGGGCRIETAESSIQSIGFVDNVAAKGGGLSFAGGKKARNKLTLQFCTFSKNKGASGGGAFFSDTLAGSLTGNTVTANQGGFYFLNDEIEKLGFDGNKFQSNALAGGAVENIVSDGDTSNPKVAANELSKNNGYAVGVIVK
jgi:predicted outer membrane repeat protein